MSAFFRFGKTFCKEIYVGLSLLTSNKRAFPICVKKYCSSSVMLKIDNGGNIEGAALVGADIAKKAVKAGITKVVFDRGGYQYHGRVEALANAARENGLEF